MAGTTTKLALYLPGGGLSGLITPDEQVDIDKINDNMKKIDTAIGFVVCTSGTRPSTPFTGQSIIETDTRNTMYWTGARWAPMDTLPNAASSTIRDALYPAPVAGNQVFRTDLMVTQVYFGTAWIPSRATATFTRATNFGLTTVAQAVPFDSAPILTGLTWVIGSPTRITCTLGGTYLVSGDLQLNSTGTGTVFVRRNGTVSGAPIVITNVSGAAVVPLALVVEVGIGDYFEIMALISTGANPWIGSNRVHVDQISVR